MVSNGIKFTPARGTITVSARREGESAVIRVADSGQGIQPDFLPHMFEAFRQEAGSTTRRQGGLGLGLSIVQHLVSAHGGKITAHSEGVGKGALFVVRLPARVASSLEKKPAGDGGTANGKSKANLDGLRVLVVDDDNDTRALMDRILADAGARVTSAHSADEALRALESTRPHVLVTDIGMPGTDGYTLMERVRRLPAARGGKTPSIAVTAYARLEDAEQAFLAGFQAHLPKPVDPARLTLLVANFAGIFGGPEIWPAVAEATGTNASEGDA